MEGKNADAHLADHSFAYGFAAGDFQYLVRRDAGGLQHLLCQLAGHGAAFAQDQCVIGQSVQCDFSLPGTSGKSVFYVHDQGQGGASQLDAQQARVGVQVRGGGQIHLILGRRELPLCMLMSTSGNAAW